MVMAASLEPGRAIPLPFVLMRRLGPAAAVPLACAVIDAWLFGLPPLTVEFNGRDIGLPAAACSRNSLSISLNPEAWRSISKLHHAIPVYDIAHLFFVRLIALQYSASESLQVLDRRHVRTRAYAMRLRAESARLLVRRVH